MKKLALILALTFVVSACAANTEVDDNVVVEEETETPEEVAEEPQGEVLGEQITLEEPSDTPVVQEEPPAEEALSEEASSGSYTVADVQTHATKEDCWTIINDKVYDLSEWLAPQPDGIYNLDAVCGVDGTLEFGGSYLAGVRADAQFQPFYLGDL